MTDPDTANHGEQQPEDTRDDHWRPATDGELIAWGHGYTAGWDQGYHDQTDNEGGAE